jgi:hypothetical protein
MLNSQFDSEPKISKNTTQCEADLLLVLAGNGPVLRGARDDCTSKIWIFTGSTLYNLTV